MESEADLLALVDTLNEFERIHNLINRFNVFEATNMARAEIRHSRFLAYLLDPSQPHGFGDGFLRAIVLAAAENHPAPPVGKLRLAIADYADARVYCERDHFDISIELPSLKLLFVIENKIGAEEHDGQLEKYRKRAGKLYPEYFFFGCFLTAEGYGGEDAEWAPLSYSAITRSLKKLGADRTLGMEVQVAIDHYIGLIEKNVMPSIELVEACKQIYRRHRAALDLIYEHGSESLLGQAYVTFQRKHPTLSHPIESRKGFLSFVPENWTQIPGFSVADRTKWKVPCPIKFWFQTTEKKVYLKLEVGPIDSVKKFDRTDFVTRLRNALGSKEPKRTGEIFTRVLNKSAKFDEDIGVDAFANLLNNLWQQIDGDKLVGTVEVIANDCLKGGIQEDKNQTRN